MNAQNNRNGGQPARVGSKFHLEIEDIKDQRLKNGNSKERLATEKITNLIVRHKEAWEQIKEDIIQEDEEEIERIWNK